MALVSIPLTVSSQVEHSAYVPEGYRLVFNEDFDVVADKDANWLKHMQNGKDRDWNYFVVGGDGFARLRGVKVTNVLGTSRVTNPSALTKQMWKYGYFECRYKYSESNGINNSFWMIANGRPLDMQTLEIDINEGQLDEEGNRQYGSPQDFLSRQDLVRPLVLEWSGNGNPSKKAYWYSSTLYGDPDYDMSQHFLTIGFLWTPDTMKFYCDGKLMLSVPNVVDNGPNKGLRWLNYAMPIYLSSMYSSNIPHASERKDGEMVVDYVRVYQNSDSLGIGEIPTEGTNLIKNGDFGSTETNDYVNGHYTGNRQTLYSWVTSSGSVKKGYFEYSPSQKRSSPQYMPAQFLHHLPDGKYRLVFKMRMTGDPKSVMTCKISDNVNLAKSNMSIGTISIRQPQCPEWKEFSYEFKLTGNEGAKEDRLMFTMQNPDTTAVFDLDDVALERIDESTGIEKLVSDVYVKAGNQLSGAGSRQINQVQVYDMNGRHVSTNSVDEQVRVPHSGVYILKLHAADGVFSRKMVIK